MTSPHLEPATLLAGRYRVDGLLGEGSVGRVVRAWDQERGVAVAIKMLHPHLADRAEVRARFLREARILNSLRHPNIVRGLDLGADEAGHPLLVMERVDGVALDAAWSTRTLPQVLGLIRQALSGLAHLHRRGLVHRDVKPANMVVEPREDGERLILLDLGLAGDGDAAEVGTPTYMAPEQAQGRPAGAPADVYAMGVILYEVLSGAPPFQGEHGVAVALQHLQAPVPALTPDPRWASVPPALIGVVEVCLAKAPSDRYEDAAALERALSRAGGLDESRPQVDAAASRIARIVGAAVRRESQAPSAVGPDVWSVVTAHCNGDARFSEALVDHLIEQGVAQAHHGRVDFARTPRPARWPKTLEALRVAQVRARLAPLNAELDLRLLTGLALAEAPAAERTVITLGETLGVDAVAAAPRLIEAGAARRADRVLMVADTALACGLRRAARRAPDGPSIHRATARALAVSEGAARAELIARLFMAGEAFAEAAGFLHRASTDAWAAERQSDAVGLLEQAVRQMSRAEVGGQRLALLRLELAERLRITGDVERAVRVAQEVAASAEADRIPTVAGRAWSMLAEVDRELGHLGEAIQGFEAAAAAFEAGGALELAAEALSAAAAVFRAGGAPDAALDVYLRADGLLPGDAAPDRRIRIRRGLGEALLRLGELEQAEAVLSEARALAERADPGATATCDWLLGEVHRVQGRLEAARQRLEVAAAAFGRKGEAESEARARISLARVLAGLGQSDAADAGYRRAVGLYHRLGQADRARALEAERAQMAGR